MYAFLNNRLIALLILTLGMAAPASAQLVGENIEVTNVNDWGSGFILTFEYEIQSKDTETGALNDWLFEIAYSGNANFGNTWMSGYGGGISSGYHGENGEFHVTNLGAGYQPSLSTGSKLTVNLLGQGSGFNASDFSIRFENYLTPAEPGTPNAAPIAHSASVETLEDTSLTLELQGEDADNNELTYRIIEQPINGAISGNGANIVYLPNENYFGSDELSFVANDGSVDSASATVTIAVTAVNDPPVVVNQTDTVARNQALTITLTGSDADDDAWSTA